MTWDMMASKSASSVQPSQRSLGWIDLQQLVSRCMGNLQLADRVLEKFLVSLEEKAAQIRTASRAGHVEELRKLSHRLKGEALNLGATEIARLASDVECLAISGRIPELLEASRELARICDSSRQDAFTFDSLKNS